MRSPDAGIFFLSVVVLILVPLVSERAHAEELYVAPDGTGDACTQTNPCRLDAGMDAVRTGGEVILLDGTYIDQVVSPRRPGVTVRAKNRHAAVIRGSSPTSLVSLVEISHSNTAIVGLRLDGQKGTRAAGIRFMNGEYKDIRIEGNRIQFFGNAAMSIGGNQRRSTIENVIVFNNIIEETGYDRFGEGIYIGANTPVEGRYVRNVEIYANEFRNFTENAVDCKDNTFDVRIHHNDIANQIPDRGTGSRGNFGTISCAGVNHQIFQNLIYNVQAGLGAFRLGSWANIRVYENIVERTLNTRDVVTHKGDQSLPNPTRVESNYFRDLSGNNVVSASGLVVEGNFGLDLPISDLDFDAKKSKLLAEIAALRAGEAPTKDTTPAAPKNLKVN
ncbi:MAG: hypothetical protein ACR2RB_13950 [Gammaproteobacteria bacterium]